MKFFVPVENAAPLRRMRGTQVTLVNQSAVDVYFDFDAQRINGPFIGGVPDGTRIAAAAVGPPPTEGQVQIDNFPGVVWLRAAAATQIEVQP